MKSIEYYTISFIRVLNHALLRAGAVVPPDSRIFVMLTKIVENCRRMIEESAKLPKFAKMMNI